MPLQVKIQQGLVDKYIAVVEINSTNWWGIAVHRLLGLDLLRFITAVAVMIFHLAFWSWAIPGSTPGQVVRGAVSFENLVAYSWWGKYGVDIFFVISGFIIAYSAANRSLGEFFRSRFLRLFPAAFVCATLTLLIAGIMQLWPEPQLWDRYFRSITFWPYGPWIDGVYWTLGIEISFYLFVSLFIAIKRFTWLEYGTWILGGISAAFIFARIFLATNWVGEMGLSARTGQLLLVYHGSSFALGTTLWFLSSKGITLPRIALLLVCILSSSSSIYLDARGIIGVTKISASALTPVLVFLGAIIALGLSIWFDKSISLRMSPRVANLIRTAGLSTYPLYLIHDVVGAYMLRQLVSAGLNQYIALVTTVVIVVAVSMTALLVAEDALRGYLGQRLWRKHKHA
ncbi:acyltransferase family protein [Limoniibacter endophyticus]|nr:acyltransferase [Limoniibacter endophyticus]